MPAEPTNGIQVSHAELLDTVMEMHNVKSAEDFSTITQFRAGLKKAQGMLAELNAQMDVLRIDRDNCQAEREAERAKVAKLQESNEYWMAQAEGKTSTPLTDDPLTH